MSCVAIARPTKSRALYAQMVGRGTRLHPGKRDLLVLDFVGNAGRHRLVSTADVLAGQLIDDDDVRCAASLLASLDSELGDLDALAMAEAFLAVDRAREKERVKVTAVARFITEELDPFLPPLPEAKRWANDSANDGQLSLGTWANNPATDKQLGVLRKYGLKPPPDLSAGQASELIGRIIARDQSGLCTFKQLRFLHRQHYKNAAQLTRARPAGSSATCSMAVAVGDELRGNAIHRDEESHMNQQKETIRARLSVSDYARQMGVKLSARGEEHRGSCPLCGSDSNKPFCANGEVWYCHVCGAKGDVFALCQLLEGLDFRASIVRLADLAGIPAGETVFDTGELEQAALGRKVIAAARQLTDQAEQARAESRAADLWASLARDSVTGLAYLRSRGVEALADDVRFTDQQVCVPLHDVDGRVVNVMKRRFSGEGIRLLGLKGCKTSGTYGDPRTLDETTGPIILVEGFFDWLSARILAPARAVLGAHSAGRLPDVARMVAERCGTRGLIFVPHKDTSDVGERFVQAAIRAARDLGITADRIHLFDVGKECSDLNDYLLAGGQVGVLETAPTLAELDGRRFFPFTDAGNAARLAHLHHDRLHYVSDMGKWYRWGDGHWRVANEHIEPVRAAIEVTEHLEREAVITEATDSDLATQLRMHAFRSQAEGRLKAMIALARARPELAVRESQLDRDPFLLACENGTLDLRTGELRAHRREDLITTRSPIVYDPDAQCPRWERFIAEVFEPNPDAAVFVQRFAGYSLTGDTSAQCLLFAHGGGANGKSVLFRAIQNILGSSLAAVAPYDTFTENRFGNAPFFALAGFRGKRAVFVPEGNQQDRLAEGLIKQITGGDAIQARFLQGQFFEYRPALKLWMSSNHLPKIQGNDRGMWRRFKLVPFEVCFDDRRDPMLEATLDAELPGILAWAVRGCLGWLGDGGGIDGLGDSVSVVEATETYRAENDQIGRFLAEKCVVGVEGARAKTTAVYAAYRAWAEQEGLRPISNVRLGRELKQRGYESQKGHRARFYPLGLASDRDDSE